MMNSGKYSWGYRGITYFTQEGCGVVKMGIEFWTTELSTLYYLAGSQVSLGMEYCRREFETLIISQDYKPDE